MSHHKWYNKGEVLSDLVELSGRYTGEGRIREVINRPPAVAAVNGEEMEELLRRCGRSYNVGNADEGPDLDYIADLIAQARQFDNHLADYNNVQSTREFNQQNSLVISKTGRLDPTVPEFRPRNTLNAPPTTKDKDELIRNEKTETLSAKIKASDVLKLELAKAAEDLKKTIIKPNTNTVESKIKRNAAIMSLMKLYSVSAPVPLRQTSFSEVNLPKPDTQTQTAREVEPVIKVPVESEVIKTNNAALDAKFDEVTPRQVAESIEKVDNWLNGKKETTTIAKPKCAVQLTPFTYKKREKISPHGSETPKSARSASSAQSTSLNIKKYVPSKYAKELCAEFEKKLCERQMEESADNTLWGYVEKGINAQKQPKKKGPE